MTTKVNGKTETLTPCRSETPDNIGVNDYDPTTMPIFVEIGPTGSAPHIAEV